MGTKHFRSRRSRIGMLPWCCWGLAAVLLLAWSLPGGGWPWLLWAALASFLIGIGAVVRSWRQGLIRYEVGDGYIALIRGKVLERVPLSRLMDANLMDRSAAREYVQQRFGPQQAGDRWRLKEARRRFLAFCNPASGADLRRTGSLQRLGPRLPDRRGSVVLLRLYGGEELLLTPRHGQGLVDTLVRMSGSLHVEG